MKKKANIITENIIFIILNLIFLSILILFVFSKAGSVAVLEEKYAKQIALTIDAAKPLMVITLKMEDVIEKAKKENFDLDDIVMINDNVVTVKLHEKGGYSYSFFNDAKVDAFPDKEGGYVIRVR
jgi:hypothetical protein